MPATATPATRAATRAGVAYRVHQYEHTDGNAYGVEAAAQLGVHAGQVFKTLVATTGDSRFVVGAVPVAAQLDLKALATAVGAKHAALANTDDAQRVTGYVIGGISPLGQKRALPVVIDASAHAFATIFVSAGKRGLEIELAPDDLAHVIGATFADIARAR
jgi:Cys-tRNA(Pro)/Cys-tRNA(Cys) deacylase